MKNILSEEIRRMKQLAGLINENEKERSETQQGNVVSQVQALVDGNPYLKGNTVTEKDLIITDKYILFVSDESLKHIKERHSDVNKPGSIINQSANLKQVVKNVISQSPNEVSGGRVKWLDVNSGIDVGFMGVSKGTPEEVVKMTDYTMPDGKKEVVKITQGQRTPTKIFNVITSELGGDAENKVVLSLITAFPGGMSIGGVSIPMDRGEMASLGLYFIVNKLSAQPTQQTQLAEVLDNLTDNSKITPFVEQTLSSYMDNMAGDTGFGYNIEDKLKKTLTLVGLKLGKNKQDIEAYLEQRDIIQSKYNTNYNEYDEGTTEGFVYLYEFPIVSYSSHDDGYGFSGSVDPNKLKLAIDDFVEIVKNL